MKVLAIEKHSQSDVKMEGAKGVKMRMLIGPDEQAGNFHMRHFEIEPDGHSPHHSHDFEHEVLVLRGTGMVRSEQGDRSFSAGDVIFVPPNEKHQFVNTGTETVTFICLIPAPKTCTL